MAELRELVRDALRRGGTDLLRDRRRFEELVCGGLDPECVEARLLGFGCDDEYLAIFADAVDEATPGAISRAAETACGYLREGYLLDAEASLNVSSAIAGGCADFLEVSFRKGEACEDGLASRVRGGGTLRNVAIAVSFAALVVLVAMGVVAHRAPIFGSTFLPVKESRAGIGIERYAVSRPGGEDSVLFLSNGSPVIMAVSVPKGLESLTNPVVYLRPGETGILIADRNTSAAELMVSEAEEDYSASQGLTWYARRGDDGSCALVIENAGEEWTVLRPGGEKVILASRGAFCRYATVSVPAYGLLLKVGENEVQVEQDIAGLALDPSCELYVGNTLVPRSAG